MTSFDLIHRPWIPVTAGGGRVEVSLMDALTRAHEIDWLDVDDPLQLVAVFRQVLLPVVLDATRLPTSGADWRRRWDAGALNGSRLTEYLDRWADRFDLFHPVAPFAQVAGLRTGKDETKPVSVLLPAMATGNNVPLFSSRTEADPPALPPARAVLALLSAHCWDTAAIKSGADKDPAAKAGKTTGNPTGPLGQLGIVIPLGRTLAETILLNTPIVAQGLRDEDRPQWCAQPATAAWRPPAGSGVPAVAPSGLLDLLTWQARRIRLIPDTPADGGDNGTVVRRVVLAAGDRLATPTNVEPHTLWRQDPAPRAGQPAVRPVRHQPGRAAWRGLPGLLATGGPSAAGVSSSLLLHQIAGLRTDADFPPDQWLQVLTAGVAYGNQSAVVEDVMSDLLPLPVAALTSDTPVRQLLEDIADEAERLRVAANRLGDDLRIASGGEKMPWNAGQRLGDVLIHQLTPLVRRLLAGLQREPGRVEDAEDAWRRSARRVAVDAALPALNAAPPEAFLGREITNPRKPNGPPIHYRLATAERRYRNAVADILARADHDTRTPPTAMTGARP